MCELCVECPDAPVDGLKDERKNQRRPRWEDAEFRTTYLLSLRSALTSLLAVDPSCVKAEHAQAVINNHCKQLKDAMHQAASAGLARITTDRRRRVHWWSHDCTVHRDRTRLYLHISDFWRVVNQAKSGRKHECKVAIDNLEKYFEDKFRACDGKLRK